jgi:hypothetical protein
MPMCDKPEPAFVVVGVVYYDPRTDTLRPPLIPLPHYEFLGDDTAAAAEADDA